MMEHSWYVKHEGRVLCAKKKSSDIGIVYKVKVVQLIVKIEGCYCKIFTITCSTPTTKIDFIVLL